MGNRATHRGARGLSGFGEANLCRAGIEAGVRRHGVFDPGPTTVAGMRAAGLESRIPLAPIMFLGGAYTVRETIQRNSGRRTAGIPVE